MKPRGFVTEDGDLCFSYALHDAEDNSTRVTEKIYDPTADAWESVRLIRNDTSDFVANQDENFVCNTESGTAVFSYGEEYILSATTAKTLYMEGTATQAMKHTIISTTLTQSRSSFTAPKRILLAIMYAPWESMRCSGGMQATRLGCSACC
ncbi:MAG: hypothetical protein ACI4J3_05650 [Oscillospiraceae bacterium]